VLTSSPKTNKLKRATTPGVQRETGGLPLSRNSDGEISASNREKNLEIPRHQQRKNDLIPLGSET